MCLSIPSKVLSIDEFNCAEVDTLGIRRKVSLDLIPESVKIGDFVLIHVGFAMQKIDEIAARESLELYKQIAEEIGSVELESKFI